MSTKRGAPAPAVVGSHFVKQYYGEVLSKKPVELHRFYKDESTFCHASGTKEEEPVSGLADIKAKIEHLGLGGATVDLGCGSVDAQPSEGGGVLLMVTGSITIAGMDPRQFCQTFFLARQHQDNDRHNYFVRNDIFRFLDVLPEVVQAALNDKAPHEEEGSTTRSASAVPVEDGPKQTPEAVGGEAAVAGMQDAPAPQTAAAAAASPVAAAAVPEAAPPSMAAGAAPPSESQNAASAEPPSTDAAVPAVAASLDNGGSAGKAPEAKVDSSPATATVAAAAPPAQPSETTADAPPASPLLPAAPAAPPAPMTYASLAKSWATVAADSGVAAAAPPASASPSGNGVAASNGGGSSGWGAPDAAPAVGAAGLTIEQPLGQPGSSVGQHGSRPTSATGKGQKGSGGYIPHHASPAVAASAAAAREAAAAGNGEIMPATSLFVRKVDMTIDRDEMIAHFSEYGDVTGISMNPTRGYAFIDYRSNECVQSALSTKEHYVNRKLLVVEERHSPMLQQRNSRGEHGGRGGRNGGRGRGSGRDGRDGDRRPTAGRGGRDRDRPDASKEGGYRARGRAEPA
ncbi:unnamed protein product [Scytosiphon promiscuus]